MDHLEKVRAPVFLQIFMEHVMEFQIYVLLAPILNNNVDLHVDQKPDIFNKYDMFFIAQRKW